VNGETYNEPRYAKEILGAGLVSGLAGGLLLVATTIVVAAVMGAPPADFARGVSAVFRGSAAMRGGVGDVVLGLAVHAAVAVAAASVFAWLVGRTTSKGKALLSALVYGAVLWAVMPYLVVRAAAPALEARMQVAPWWVWLVAHLLYALPLALSPALQRRIGREPGPRAEPAHEWVGRPSQVPDPG
jgi:hypothetical protein